MGGAERVTLNLTEGLLDLGCRVDLVMFSTTGELLADVPGGARIVDLRCGRALHAPVPLTRYLRRERPDVLVAAMGHTNLVAQLAHWLAGSRARLLLAEHTAVSAKPLGFRDRIYRVLARWAYPRATAVVAVSRGVADSLVERMRLDRRTVSVIYNPVLTRRYRELAQTSARHEWLRDGRTPVVLGAGRLAPEKDFPTLIAAFAAVAAQREARLLILGEGPARKALEGQIERLGLHGSVALPGYVDDAVSYMAASDVFVLSSVHEGLPTVLIEALGAGVPVVSTDCESGPREILRGGALGRLVPVGDTDALAAAIVAALEQPRGEVPADALGEYEPKAAARRYLQAAGLDA